MPKPISSDVRDQILARVREGKDTIVEIARQHGIKVDTVYGWVSRGVNGLGSVTLENLRLKRENQRLKEIIGNLVLNESRGKKD
jgi:transposase-like protein